MAEQHSLNMVLPQERLSAFFPLLQRGVWLQSRTGCSVASLLTEQFNIEESYIVERITTLFLDFKPVDDLETTFVKDGATLALSSAMPGLVGTTMRRGSHLAAMRGDISCQSKQGVPSGTGRVKIKLFNIVMAELGASFLAHGICLTNSELGELLSEMNNNFLQTLCAVSVDGQQIDPASLNNRFHCATPDNDIILKVVFKD